VIGRAEVVGTVTHERLSAFHRERYVAENVVIAAAGSLEHDAVVALAAGTPAFHGAAPTAATEQPEFERRVRFLRKDTEQYHVCLGGGGIAREDERRFALRVLEGVLGGTSSSRLFQEVRERRGLAYSVFSFSNLYAHTGEVGLYLGTRAENLREALAVVAQELERAVEDPATPQELERSRENLKGRMVLALESTGARMSRLGTSILNGMPILSLDEVIERIDAVDIEQLRALGGELFSPQTLSLAAVGPDEESFRAALEPLELAETAPEPTPGHARHAPQGALS
jgi:predicted Zn-dependent peptidase